MTIVGFYLGLHDSNICAIVGDVCRYRKFERRSGTKHERAHLTDLVDTCREWDVTPDYLAFSDGNRNGLGTCHIDELFRPVASPPHFNGCVSYCVDHHFAHILSAAMLSTNQLPSLGIAIDGRGDNDVRARVVRLGPGLQASNLYHSVSFSLARYFAQVGYCLKLSGSDLDFAGKVMGAQAYGRVDEEYVDRFRSEEPDRLPSRLLSDARWRGISPWSEPGFFCVDNTSFLDWLATTHQILAEALIRFFEDMGADSLPIHYAGGCAQNSVFNEILTVRFPQLVIPPHAYDGGLSLGCVEFLRRLLQLPPLDLNSYPFIQDDEHVGFASESSVTRVAELLARGNIVGWMQGHGEAGPRALGHRSILLDPTRTDAKSLLNDRVKRREPWRPYAASVLEEHTADWFVTDQASPYMLRTIMVSPQQRQHIPGVVHRDGTCRIQTVGDASPLTTFRSLLERFRRMTGIPLILNTSLNGGGEPIYGTAAQANRLFSSGRLDALCVGDEVSVA